LGYVRVHLKPIRAGSDENFVVFDGGFWGIPSLDEINLVSYSGEFAAENRDRLVDRWVEEVLGQ
jgi:hypothetical protein